MVGEKPAPPPRDDGARLDWLQQALLPEHLGVTVENTIATGCRCMSCYVWRIAWLDARDEEQSVEGETLREAIDLAARRHP